MKENNNFDVFYTTKDLMEIFHIGKNKAYKLMNQRDFPSIKLGNKYLVSKSNLEEFLNRYKYKSYLF